MTIDKRLIALGIAGVVMAGVVVSYFATLPWTSSTGTSIPWFGICIAAAVVLGIIFFARGGGPSIGNPFAIFVKHPKITLFVVWTIFIYIAAVYLHKELRDWLWTPNGVGLLALLVVMVVILCLLVDVFKSSWMTTVIFVLLTVAVVDPGIFRQVPEAFKAKFASPSSNTTTAATTPECNMPKTEWWFDHTPDRVNPGGRCGPDLWHDGHCLYVRRAESAHDTQKYTHCGGKLPPDVEWAWTADTPFMGAVALGPPRYNY